MNKYSYGKYKGNDNLLLIQNLSNELSIIKEKLKISQIQLNNLTIQYQKAIKQIQILKETNLDLTKKNQTNTDDDELYEILDNLRKQNKKLYQKLLITEDKQKQIKIEKETLIEENNKLKNEIQFLKNELEKIKEINSNQKNKTRHFYNKTENIELEKILERTNLLSNENDDNFLKKTYINSFLSDRNNTSKNIDKTINEIKDQLKLTKKIKEQKSPIYINFNNEINGNLITSRSISEIPNDQIIKSHYIRNSKEEINKSLENIKYDEKNLFRNAIKNMNKKEDKINSYRANSFNLYSKKQVLNNLINLKKEKKIFEGKLNTDNNINMNTQLNCLINNFSNNNINIKSNKTMLEKKISLESLRKSLNTGKKSPKKYLTSENSIDKYQDKIKSSNKIKENMRTLSFNNENNINNNEINIGLYRFDDKEKKLIFFNLISHKFEYKNFLKEKFSFLQNISKEKILIYSINSLIFFLITNLYEEQNEFFYYNMINESFGKLENPKSFHINPSLISYFSNCNNIICFSGSNTISVEIFNLSKKKWSYLPYLDNPYSDSSLLIIDDSKLFCFFGYDYVNNSFNKNILWIDLKYINKWNKININLEIKNQFVFKPKNINNKQENVFLILGGIFSNNIPNSDMIQLIINKNNNCEIYSNYNMGNSYNESFLFNNTFIDYFDSEKQILYKCGYDQKYNVHIIDTTNIKHHIYDCNGNNNIK